MIKQASLEETEITDPRHGKEIRISTTTRLIYRKAYPQEYGAMRNARLNQVIAKEFAAQANSVLHYFRLGESGREGVAEIRGNASSFFIAAIKDDSVDVLTIQNSWFKPKYRGTRENPIELGDE